jgi:RNA polymerase sigma-70 factor (ECF subfamily)
MVAEEQEALAPATHVDAGLAERFARGDADAFELLFRRHEREVYRWICRIVRDGGAAEDLTVETFWRVWRYRERYDARRPFGAWLRRVASNASLDYLKSRTRETALVREPTTEQPADPVAAGELRRCVRRAFQMLPAKLQATATLALVEEMPYQEIAASLGTSIGAVKLRVWRAVRLLRHTLKQMGVDYERS